MVGMWMLDSFKAKWTDSFSSIMIDWEIGGHVACFWEGLTEKREWS